MPIFSQFGEIVWQRLFNIARILQTTALKGQCHQDSVLDENLARVFISVEVAK